MKKNVRGCITAAMYQLMSCIKGGLNSLRQKIQNEASDNPSKLTFKSNLRFATGKSEWNWREHPFAVLSAEETKELLAQIKERGGINVVFVGQNFGEYLIDILLENTNRMCYNYQG